ncbi:unnamed protein product [Ectocarpus sp. 8 AP-2014]
MSDTRSVMERDAGSGSAGVGPDQNSCVKVFIIAFNEMWGETWDAKGWYTSTKELQLASLEFCKVCRTYQTLHLNVEARTPRRLLAATDAPPLHPKRPCGTRLPRLRARSVTWNMPTAGELRNPIFAMTDSDRLVFGRGFEGNLEAVAWPRRLKTIDMRYSNFNKPLERMRFPASLETIVLSEVFNQPIDRVEFPASLRQLIFSEGSSFNQPITGGFLPSSLQEIALGEQFNQPIEDMVWPPSLLKLHLGYEFDQPIQRVVFPPSLQELTVEGSFNQPIEGVSWPDSLQKLALGFSFNRSIDNVRWPASLQEITFASCEDYGDNAVTVYADFNQSIGSSVWPASLRRLTLGEHFRQSLQGLGTWIPNLEALRLLDHKDGSGTEESLLRGIEWPMVLRHLAVIKGSNLDGVTIPSVVQVDFLEHVF